MAKTNAESKITKPIEETLWKSANRLCGAMESSEYKHVVLESLRVAIKQHASATPST